MRRTLAILVLSMLTAALAGCDSQPRVVVGDLPRGSILGPAGGNGSGGTGSGRGVSSQAGPPGWAPAVAQRPWKYIVLHHSSTDAGSAEAFDDFHRNVRKWSGGLGYHFVICNGQGGRDGQVEVGPRWTQQKWGAHTGGTPANEYNNYGIGICLVGDFGKTAPTRAQLASLEKLVTFLAQRYDIPPARVVGHQDAPGAKTECPGESLRRYLYEVLRPRLAGRR